MVNALTLPRSGDHVAVDWGFDTLEGVVESIYRSGIGVRVTVTVPVLGPSGEELDRTTVTVPLETINSL